MDSLRSLPQPLSETRTARDGRRVPNAARARLRALAVVAGLLVAGPAHAQVLISTIGQSDGGQLRLKSSSGAQRFTTGSHAAGYTLTSIELKLEADNSPKNHNVSLRSGSANGTVVVSFNNPTPALIKNTKRNYTFAPASSVTLDPETHYWVRIDKRTSSDVVVRTTTAGSYDGTPAASFTMRSKYELRTSNSGSFSVSPFPSTNLRFLLRVNGSAVNSAPTAANGSVATDQNTDYVFRESDFDFSDGDAGDTLASVKVETLPSPGKGILKFDGGEIDPGDLPRTVTKMELDENKLVYAPPANAFGKGFASFDFKVNDGKDDSATAYTMTVDVNKVLIRPVVANVIADQTAMVDTAFSFQLAGDAFSNAKAGSLTYSATQYDGTALPSWLSFAPGTRTFSGTPQSGDAGRVPVKVTATDVDGGKGYDSFDIVVSAKPSISGTARVGQTLTARTGSTDSFTYEWIRVDGMDESTISGASSGTYTLDAADLGKKVKVKVSFTANGQPAEQTSDAYPPHVPIQSATCGTADLAGRQQVWAGTLGVAALLAGPRTELVGYGWSSAAGGLSGLGDAIVLGANSYRVGRQVLRFAHSGDLVALMRSPPGSLVFSLIGSGESRDTNRATQELTAAEKAALRLHVCERSFDFSDANLLHWGNYEWQASDLVWAAGDSIPLKLSVPTSFQQAALDAPAIDGAPAVSGAGEDGSWTAGEAVRVALGFSETVVVDTAGGTPSVEIGLGGTAARSAAYESGSGTAELVFAYTLVEADGAHSAMAVTPNSLVLGGGTIRGTATGFAALLAHEGLLTSGGSARSGGPKARFGNVPKSHDGATAFRLGLRFSGAPAGLDPKRDAALVLAVAGGRVTGARQTATGANPAWEITVAPDGMDGVTVRVPARACNEAHAVCIGGQPLAEAAEAAVPGPPLLSVADAQAEEAEGATLDFVVTLSRALSHAVTVRYATADGTAAAGDDYGAASGTLTFAADETSRTVSVRVLNDPHDESSETLTLTLSNPRPSRVKLADAAATGTITNTGAIPRAWIARFGRTVAEQVLDAIEGRMRAGRRAGAELRLAGERIGLRPLFAAGGNAVSPGPRNGVRDRSGSGAGGVSEERTAGDLAASLKGGPVAGRRGLGARAGLTGRTRTIDAGELLLGSSFGATAGTAREGFLSLWGRGAVTRFDGREGAFSLDGEVTSAMLGTDFSRARWTAGLLVSRSLGDGRYRDGSGAAGNIEAALTGLYPWVRHALGDRLEAWGAAGYGVGRLTLKPGAASAIRTDLDLWMAAAGLRGAVLDGGRDALTLTAKTDATIVGTTTEAVSGGRAGRLAAAKARVTRLRLGLEGVLPVALGSGIALTPRLEIGARHDGGDAETGFGIDLGGGLSFADPGRGIRAELRGRGLLSHAAKGFRERGVSGSLSWQPGSGGRGPRLSLTQTLGGPSSGGADALFGRPTLAGLAADDRGGGDLGRRRLEARFGYGLAVFGNRFTLTPEAGLGLSEAGRDMSLGWRLARGGDGTPGGGALELSLEARRRESADDHIPPEHLLGFLLNARF